MKDDLMKEIIQRTYDPNGVLVLPPKGERKYKGEPIDLTRGGFIDADGSVTYEDEK